MSKMQHINGAYMSCQHIFFSPSVLYLAKRKAVRHCPLSFSGKLIACTYHVIEFKWMLLVICHLSLSPIYQVPWRLKAMTHDKQTYFAMYHMTHALYKLKESAVARESHMINFTVSNQIEIALDTHKITQC